MTETTATERTFEIVPVDNDDDAALKAWHDVYLAADTFERPFVTPWQYEEMLAMVRGDPETWERISYLGLEDGVPVATLGAQLPLRDNLSNAMFLTHTLPDRRRRGHATRLLERLESDLAPRGRTVLQSDVDFAYDLGPDGPGEPGVEFLRARGFAFALGNVQSSLDLPVDETVLAKLAEGAAPYHRDYTMVEYVGRCPDEHVESFAALQEIFMDEAPMGEMTVEREVYDEARIRNSEEVLVAAQRVQYMTLALDKTGAVVAFTQLVVPRLDPGRVFQWGTIVHPDHRGHRLGTALKVANHAQVQRHETDLRICHTYNAEVNAHMIAVNQLLGYRPTARLGEFEKRLA